MIVINKADGSTKNAAERAASEYRRALHILKPISPTWMPPVHTCSAISGDGLADIWKDIENHRELLITSGEFDEKRKQQRVRWMWSMIQDRLLLEIEKNKSLQKLARALETQVMEDQITPGLAASKVVAAINAN
jgi:LAO/AO transport system kinase